MPSPPNIPVPRVPNEPTYLPGSTNLPFYCGNKGNNLCWTPDIVHNDLVRAWIQMDRTLNSDGMRGRLKNY